MKCRCIPQVIMAHSDRIFWKQNFLPEFILKTNHCHGYCFRKRLFLSPSQCSWFKLAGPYIQCRHPFALSQNGLSPSPPLFSGKSDLWWVKRIPAWRGEGGGGGELTLQYLPASLIVKDKSKITLFSKLPSTVLKSHYSKPINSRDVQLRNSEKYFWNVIVLQGEANQEWEN